MEQLQREHAGASREGVHQRNVEIVGFFNELRQNAFQCVALEEGFEQGERGLLKTGLRGQAAELTFGKLIGNEQAAIAGQTHADGFGDGAGAGAVTGRDQAHASCSSAGSRRTPKLSSGAR